MQRTASRDTRPQDERSSVREVEAPAPMLDELIGEVGGVGCIADVALDLVEANAITGDELDLVDLPALDADDEGALWATLGGFRASRLRIAWIDDPGVSRAGSFGEGAARLDMAEREVIESRLAKIVERARAVVPVSFVTSDVAVQQADVQARALRAPKPERKVLFGGGSRVADPLDGRDRLAVSHDWNDFDRLRTKDLHLFRPR